MRRALAPILVAVLGVTAPGCTAGDAFPFMGEPADYPVRGLAFLAGGIAEGFLHAGAHVLAAEHSNVHYTVRGDRILFLREDLDLEGVSDGKYLNVVRAGLLLDHGVSETMFWVDPERKNPFWQGMQAGSIFLRGKIGLENGADVQSISESSNRVSEDALRAIVIGGALADIARWTFPDSKVALGLSWAGRGAFLFSVEIPF